MQYLPIKTQVFYIELGDEFGQFRELVGARIRQIFPNAKMIWSRLSSFDQWKNASKEIDPTTDLILLQSNFDHAYVSANPNDFAEFCRHILEEGERVLGEITHFPEGISEIAIPWGAFQNLQTNHSYFVRDTERAVGTTLITLKLFKEWWIKDFTNGKMIVRPDNPFGPSVVFPKAKLVIPFFELFRHLDGYEHVGIKSPWAKKIQPCCQVQDFQIVHDEWKRGTYSELRKPGYNEIDLPHLDELSNGYYKNRIMLAAAHRIDLRLLFIIATNNGNFSPLLSDKLKILKVILRVPFYWKTFLRFLLENTLIAHILSVVHYKQNPRNSNLLSEIMSHGTSRGITLTIYRMIRRKTKKAINWGKSRWVGAK
jgi:hypothetical protein